MGFAYTLSSHSRASSPDHSTTLAEIIIGIIKIDP